jgi:hypothetical protein
VSCDAEVGELVVSSFAAFEDDGYTKRSGLTAPGDFTTTVFLDGAADPLSVTITEIGSTGQYSVQFTPDAVGVWHVQVLIDFNKDIWFGEYHAVESSLETILAQCEKIDLQPTLGTGAVATGCLMDRLMNKDTNKTYNQLTDSLEGVRDRSG